jgi:hypothetical protein
LEALKMKQVRVYMPERLADLVEDAADHQATSTAAFIRGAAIRELERSGIVYEPQEIERAA